MAMKTTTLLALVAALLVCALPTLVSGKVVIGYYANWAQYRAEPHKFVPEKIDPTQYTHLCYAFAKVDADTFDLVPTEFNDVLADGSGMYARFNALKQRNPALKTLISLGGYNFGSSVFSPMVASAASRAKFVANTIRFCRQHGFDGVDIDWEFPGSNDRANFAQLLRELRAAVNSETSDASRRLLITIATAAGEETILQGLDIPALAQTLDYVNLMSYDYFGSWNAFTGHNSPLYLSNSAFHCEHSVNVFLRNGLPRSQLVLGIALYARSWTLSNPSNWAVGAPASGPGASQPVTATPGFMALYETLKFREDASARTYFDATASIRYLVKDSFWMTYETQLTTAIKVAYVKQKRLAGVMFWSVDMDIDTPSRFPPLVPLYSSALLHEP